MSGGDRRVVRGLVSNAPVRTGCAGLSCGLEEERMTRQPSTETYPPLTDPELVAAEQRARLLPEDWPREGLLRLIAAVRRSRWALRTPSGQTPATPAPEVLDPDYTPRADG